MNQADRPLLISTSDGVNLGNITALSHLLTPKVRLRLVVEPNMLQIPDGFTDIFLLNPPEPLHRKLQKEGHYRFEAAYSAAKLWRLASSP